MDFLPYYIYWILSGNLTTHSRSCKNKVSGDSGICASLWSCEEVIRGTNIGTCGNDRSEDICCKMNFLSENGNRNLPLSSAEGLNAGTTAHKDIYFTSSRSYVSTERIPSVDTLTTSDKSFASKSQTINVLPVIYRKPVAVENTHNMRKPAEIAKDSSLRQPVIRQSDHDLLQPVVRQNDHDLLQPVIRQTDHDLLQPAIKESDHNLRLPVIRQKDHDLQQYMPRPEVHDLRWPVLEELDHDLRNTYDAYQSELVTESYMQEEPSRKKYEASNENEYFSSFYELFNNQSSFTRYEEKDNVNKECVEMFSGISRRNKDFENQRDAEKLRRMKILNSASQICGVSLGYRTGKLVGAKESRYLQWPWMVSLRIRHLYSFWHKCGAALLNTQWVVTVAHCVELLSPWDVSLRLGIHNLKREDEHFSYVIRTVDRIIIHPQFNYDTLDNDVALLLMSEPVEFRPNIAPICLPKKIDKIEDKKAIVLGWGKNPEIGLLSGALHELLLPVLSNKECELMYSKAGRQEKILDNSFCAGIAEGGSDPCEGDSGGPTFIRDADGKWALIGLVSWGGVCGAPHQPGVYTRIKNYVEWIEITMICYEY